MSARHSIEPISVSFKRGFAALHHALMKGVDGECGNFAAGRWAEATMLRIALWDSAATMLRIAL
ncbi:hypothetical protein LB553_14725 [Mesorhizobium sp. CA8]|uniref:hypothetical protein n=1 Tax=Mesorhizobium sp. CA8 TaxID=2876637 RepID=UPI001CCA8C5A|nr:hypothetical protein [Mesorhizobium sp. CA8]MBZ9762118.1 hypothetical protein [Mesorhizobium sp. CA8]